MKRIILLMAISLLVTASGVKGTVTTFEPDPTDMYDLDHWRFYIWSIDLGFSSTDYEVTDAVLSFDNITNWDDSDNIMSIYLLDASYYSDLIVSYDDNVVGEDAFTNIPSAVLIETWEDTDGAGTTEDLDIIFDSSILSILSDYTTTDTFFAIGIDPDCHYWNDGISLTITYDENPTTAGIAPAPGAVILGSFGVGLVGWLRRRKMLE